MRKSKFSPEVRERAVRMNKSQQSLCLRGRTMDGLPLGAYSPPSHMRTPAETEASPNRTAG